MNFMSSSSKYSYQDYQKLLRKIVYIIFLRYGNKYFHFMQMQTILDTCLSFKLIFVPVQFHISDIRHILKQMQNIFVSTVTKMYVIKYLVFNLLN